jgi:hypothetical protein
MAPDLPQGVIEMMAERAHRMHHYLWHAVRNGWLSFSPQTRDAITARGWKPPRPAVSGDEPILDNASGEDFLYMHHQMIAAVNNKLAEIGDATYSKVDGWAAPPDQNDADWPVPPTYSLGQPDDDAYVAECKSDGFFTGQMMNWASDYTNPDVLKATSLGELGSRIEFTIHNRMHMRWSAEPPHIRPDMEPEAADAIEKSWDDPAYNFLGDTYSAHLNPTFWKIHGWVDHCIDLWMQANNKQAVSWTGTWVGPMPHDAPDNSIFAQMPKREIMHGPHHRDHISDMIAVAKEIRSSGFACHFYDNIKVPPLPSRGND